MINNFKNEENYHNLEDIYSKQNSSFYQDEKNEDSFEKSFYYPHQLDEEKKGKGNDNKNINGSSKRSTEGDFEEKKDEISLENPNFLKTNKKDISSIVIKITNSTVQPRINRKKSLNFKKYLSKKFRKKHDDLDDFVNIPILFGEKAYTKIFKTNNPKNESSIFVIFKRKKNLKILEHIGFFKEERIINTDNTNIYNIINDNNNTDELYNIENNNINENNLEEIPNFNNIIEDENDEQSNNFNILSDISSNHNDENVINFNYISNIIVNSDNISYNIINDEAVNVSDGILPLNFPILTNFVSTNVTINN